MQRFSNKNPNKNKSSAHDSGLIFNEAIAIEGSINIFLFLVLIEVFDLMSGDYPLISSITNKSFNALIYE